jgi:putative redox protein
MDLLTVGSVKVPAAAGMAGRCVLVHAGGHLIHAEDSRPRREIGAGSSPYHLVLAGLGACTFIALKKHAARKRWEVGSMQIVLRMTRSPKGMQIERTISVEGSNGSQKTELAIIAERTPVTLALQSGVAIRTAFI